MLNFIVWKKTKQNSNLIQEAVTFFVERIIIT